MSGTTLALKVNGRALVLDLRMVSALDEAALKAGPGLRVADIGDGLSDGSLVALAAFVFLARRHNGEPDIEWATVASEVTYGTQVEIVDTDTPDDEDPKEPAAAS